MVLEVASTSLSPSLPPANAQHKPNRESKKKTMPLPTISQCVSSFANDHVVVPFSPLFFASRVFLKDNMDPIENSQAIQIIFKTYSL